MGLGRKPRQSQGSPHLFLSSEQLQCCAGLLFFSPLSDNYYLNHFFQFSSGLHKDKHVTDYSVMQKGVFYQISS